MLGAICDSLPFVSFAVYVFNHQSPITQSPMLGAICDSLPFVSFAVYVFNHQSPIAKSPMLGAICDSLSSVPLWLAFQSPITNHSITNVGSDL
jgi:hypothetical protein